MVVRFLVLSLLAAHFHSCCRKTACVLNEDVLPSILIEYSNITTGNQNTVVYTLENNVVTDSTIFSFYHQGLQFSPYRFANEPNINKRIYLVKRNSKVDTIYDVNSAFEEVKTSCGKCFLSNEQFSTHLRYTDFSFKHKNKVYGDNVFFLLEY